MGLRRFVTRLLGSGDDSRDATPPVPKTTAVITRSFKATVADELSVHKGSVVRAMYREDDWVYVESPDGRRGFIPAQYCAIRRRDDQKEARRLASSLRGSADWSKSNLQRFLDSLPAKKDDTGTPYILTRLGTATTLFRYEATSDGDLNLSVNGKVTVLNADDPQWLYVEDERRERGFVPASYVQWNEHVDIRPSERFLGQNLLVAEDYKSRSPLDLNVHSGEWVIGIFDEQEPFVWARKGGKEGFVPTRCVVLATDL